MSHRTSVKRFGLWIAHLLLVLQQENNWIEVKEGLLHTFHSVLCCLRADVVRSCTLYEKRTWLLSALEWTKGRHQMGLTGHKWSIRGDILADLGEAKVVARLRGLLLKPVHTSCSCWLQELSRNRSKFTLLKDGSLGEMLGLFPGVFLLLLVVYGALTYFRPKENAVTNPNFTLFQRSYLSVYILVIMSDWLQGPYLYELYSHYGFGESQIAVLYVTGFAASAIFGTFTGGLADKFGRKRLCLVFCVLYSLSCLTKTISSVFVLLVGRLLGGISTSLLFSVFESWYLHEHLQTHDFPPEWTADTFSKSTLLNGIVAVLAGVVSHVVAEVLRFGPVSPFLVAILFLVASGVMIKKTWQENYGSSDRSSSKAGHKESLRYIFTEPAIFLVGMMQSLFESSMYIFVFLWTPVLSPAKPPLGLVFASFMVAIMIGSNIFDRLFNANVRTTRVLQGAFGLLFFSFSICTVFFSKPYICFAAFLVLELACGLYFPSIGYLRGQHVPEEFRAAIMNWFRVPLNVIVAGVLLLLFGSRTAAHTILILCCGMSGIGIMCSQYFHKRSSPPPSELPLHSNTSWLQLFYFQGFIFENSDNLFGLHKCQDCVYVHLQINQSRVIPFMCCGKVAAHLQCALSCVYVGISEWFTPSLSPVECGSCHDAWWSMALLMQIV